MEKTEMVCPWWMGYFLINPIRKLMHDPEKILEGYIKKGMNTMDFGSAMGYFSLPMARMTGETGNVYCVDIQEKMLEKLQKRANKAGLGKMIIPCFIGKGFSMEQLSGQIDFTMLFAVVHEVPDKKQLFRDLYQVSKNGAKVLFAEPKGHVTLESFQKSIQLAKDAGFRVSEEKPGLNGLCVILVKLT